MNKIHFFTLAFLLVLFPHSAQAINYAVPTGPTPTQVVEKTNILFSVPVSYTTAPNDPVHIASYFYWIDTDTNTANGGVVEDGYGFLPYTYEMSPSPHVVTMPASLPSTGTYYARFCVDKNNAGTIPGYIAETNESDNCSPWTTLTATPRTTYPNLQAGPVSITPTTFTHQTNITLSSTISNTGAGATDPGVQINTVFQMADDAQGTNAANQYITTYPPSIVSEIPAGGSKVTTMTTTLGSFSNKLSAGGTFYFRACTDSQIGAQTAIINTQTSGSTVLTQAESNENDNCGAWTPISVSSYGGSSGVTLSFGGIVRTSPFRATSAGTAVVTSSLSSADALAAGLLASEGDGCTVWNANGTGQSTSVPFSAISKSFSHNGGIGIRSRGYTCTDGAQGVALLSGNPLPFPSGWYVGFLNQLVRGKTYYSRPNYAAITDTFSKNNFVYGTCPAGTTLGSISYIPNPESNWLAETSLGFPILNADEKLALGEWAAAYCNQFAGATCCSITPDYTAGGFCAIFKDTTSPFLKAYAQNNCSGGAYVPLTITAVSTTAVSPLAQALFTPSLVSMNSGPEALSVTLTANPDTIDKNDQSLLTWSSTGAVSCESTDFQTASATSGTVTVSPLITTEYSVTCYDGAATGETAYATVTVNTTQCSDGEDNDGDGDVDMADGGCDDGNDNDESGEVRADLTANPTQVPVGASSTLTWSCAGGATSASIAGIGAVSPASGGTITTPSLTNPSNNFELTCTSPTDTDTDIAVVTTTNPTGDITADPERVLKGTSSTLDWACYDQAVTFSVSGTNGFTAGTKTGTDVSSQAINTQTTFTLFCDSVAVDTAIVNIEVNVDEF